MALFLTSKLNIFETSIIIGIQSLAAVFFGSFSYIVENKIGTVNSLLFSFILSIISYIGFIWGQNFSILLLFSIFSGFSRVIGEPVTKALFSHHAKNNSSEMAFRIRYISICVGGVLGPLFCNLLSISGNMRINFYVSITLYLIIILIILKKRKYIDVPLDKNYSNKVQKVKIGSVDIRLYFYIIGGTLIFYVFSQFESVFSLFLNNYHNNPEFIYSILLILNSLTCILLQFLMVKFSYLFSKVTPQISILVGNFFFFIAFIMFSLSRGNIFWLIVSIIIYSVGEIMTIPSVEVMIDKIAPAKSKAFYFGLAEFRSLGFILGPIFFGFLINRSEILWACISSAFIILFSSFFFLPGNSKSHDHP